MRIYSTKPNNCFKIIPLYLKNWSRISIECGSFRVIIEFLYIFYIILRVKILNKVFGPCELHYVRVNDFFVLLTWRKCIFFVHSFFFLHLSSNFPTYLEKAERGGIEGLVCLNVSFTTILKHMYFVTLEDLRIRHKTLRVTRQNIRWSAEIIFSRWHKETTETLRASAISFKISAQEHKNLQCERLNIQRES